MDNFATNIPMELYEYGLSLIRNDYDLGIQGESLSSITTDKRIFPPYIPFVPPEYDNNRILVYATAQNLFKGCDMYNAYEKNYDKLPFRLYYDELFDKQYGSKEFTYKNIPIQPYKDGVLPALVGVYIAVKKGKMIQKLSDVCQCFAVTNYFKWSLHNGRDKNPKDVNDPKYKETNRLLVKEEVERLSPKVIIAFKDLFSVQTIPTNCIFKQINDPSWMKRGGGPGKCLSEDGSWAREIKNFNNSDLKSLVNGYIEELGGVYRGGKKAKFSETYLLKYAHDWSR